MSASVTEMQMIDRSKDTLLRVYIDKVRETLEDRIREELMPLLNTAVKESANTALESIKPSIYTYFDEMVGHQFIAIKLIIDEKTKQSTDYK